MSDHPENLAGRLARAFIESKLTIVLIVGIVVVGVLAVLLTPREENPQILVAAAQVSVTVPGASAKEVEELVVTPLEGILREMTGVDHTNATALNSVGIVPVQFKVGQSKELSLVKLYNSVLSNLGRLPADAGIPQIKAVDVDDVAVVVITLASPSYDDYALKRLADRMAERLHSLDNVSVVTVRALSIMTGSFLAGIGGAYLSLVYPGSWTRLVSSGQGLMAVALVIFARWDPRRCLVASLLFGGAQAVGPALQAAGVKPGDDVIVPVNTFIATAEAEMASSRAGRPESAPGSPSSALCPFRTAK